MLDQIYGYHPFLKKLNESKSGEIISPDFTPHEEFHKHRWLLPSGGTWYYKLKDLRPCVIPKNSKFSQSLDPELKQLVDFLHSKKIPTTPSCAGHFTSDDEWSTVFDSLSDQKEKIKTTGLELIDPEDGSRYNLKNSNYELPWDKKAFVERAKEHSKFGVLGIYDPGNFFAKNISKKNIPNSQVTKDGSITLFLTSPKSDEELKECWSKLTETFIPNP
jgi:hypothetical protein